ncbi:Flavoprotein-like [Syntrophomonas zehnderi OL-4]|uniref:Flavoprotein-like n=1 Tax=Syntrophomonas zehnderi OL-4 TaxID=690567 RepID=A0A0E4GBZ7_9FIRM|nr:NAD(P)H-dependent oxidoreductase [Syntrophomonas zehnderi]CFW99382.1 Flavoprotein-like [Syntrophomonas zehnderi OL-4]
MKKVLGLIISHRKLGNSELLVKEIMGSIPQECNRELIRLTDLKIEPCKACYKCLQPDKICPVKDDFNFVIEKIKEADALVIGVPVYFLGPHGYYKMLTDRLVGAQNDTKSTQGKPCVIVMPYGSKGWEGYSKSAAIVMPKLLRMKLVDCWQVHATLPGESLLNPENISYAQTLGRDIFTGREYHPGTRECPVCGSDLFRLLPAKQVECPICGARGIIKEDCIPVWTDSDYHRFSDQMDKHFKRWLLEMKMRFSAAKDQLKDLQKSYRDQSWWIKP